MPSLIPRTLQLTKNPYQTRITLSTTSPRLHPLSERIQKQKTHIPPYLTNHLFLIKRENHQEQRKRQKEELLYP